MVHYGALAPLAALLFLGCGIEAISLEKARNLHAAEETFGVFDWSASYPKVWDWLRDESPDEEINFLLCRPGDDSIDLSVWAPSRGFDFQVKWGADQEDLSLSNEWTSVDFDEAVTVTLSGLSPSNQYYYQVVWQDGDTSATSEIHSFRTQRAPGEDFTFVMQADSHIGDYNGLFNFVIYNSGVKDMTQWDADFLIDLGDTIMTEKYAESMEDARELARAQRNILGVATSGLPFFLTLGNHEGERSETDDFTVWDLAARQEYFPAPTREDSFFVADPTSDRGSHYAWEWGDALFITLDMLFNSVDTGTGWDVSLGYEQYVWMTETLESSTAKFKFVFAHAPVGGFGSTRGGARTADFFEMGGFSGDGTYEFDTRRPGVSR
jgi:hypothetical protein